MIPSRLRPAGPRPRSGPLSVSPGEEIVLSLACRQPVFAEGGVAIESGLPLRELAKRLPLVASIVGQLPSGFRVSAVGRYTVVVRAPVDAIERAFGTRIIGSLQADVGGAITRLAATLSPAAIGKLAQFVESISIQQLHLPALLPLAGSGAALNYASTLPTRPGTDALGVLEDIPAILKADRVHTQGTTGRGIRVAMIDTGFEHEHPFFAANGFRSTVVVPVGASNPGLDLDGHGTGESANLFAVAPGVEFIGVKLNNDDQPGSFGASLLEGFLAAVLQKPRIISMSIGYDLCVSDNRSPQKRLPGWLGDLRREIAAAVKEKGVVVVAGAGNGSYEFPAQMREVIAVGGVCVPRAGASSFGPPCASDSASAYTSAIYSRRSIPDCCGLSGMAANRRYIMLPVRPDSRCDSEYAKADAVEAGDGTSPADGWAAFSGTSAAAPQIAGVCALLLEKNPRLTPAEVRKLLVDGAQEVTVGRAYAMAGTGSVGVLAGDASSAGKGIRLVDAYESWSHA